MDNLTNEILAAIQLKMKRLQELQVAQDTLTQELLELEKRYDLEQVTQDELDEQLAVLIPRHQRQQQEIAVAFAEIERLRQDIFAQTGLELPPINGDWLWFVPRWTKNETIFQNA